MVVILAEPTPIPTLIVLQNGNVCIPGEMFSHLALVSDVAKIVAITAFLFFWFGFAAHYLRMEYCDDS